jgi:hypothetical protein
MYGKGADKLTMFHSPNVVIAINMPNDVYDTLKTVWHECCVRTS